MKKISLQCLCDYDENESPEKFTAVQMKGDAAAFACAYPTKDSFGPAACERASRICTDSFVRRPSMQDKAYNMISQFINEAVYGVQEPHKVFLCSLASVFLLKNNIRILTSGNAAVAHYFNGSLIKVYYDHDYPIFGKSLKVAFPLPPMAELKRGEHAFLLMCGSEDTRLNGTDAEKALAGAESAEMWLNGFEKQTGTSMLGVMLPERSNPVMKLFGGGKQRDPIEPRSGDDRQPPEPPEFREDQELSEPLDSNDDIERN